MKYDQRILSTQRKRTGKAKINRTDDRGGNLDKMEGQGTRYKTDFTPG
jgi:hypothetical protein